MAVAAVAASASAPPIWVNPGAGSWFTLSNWRRAAVIVAGDPVMVNNAGTA
jgi:hypothetical protein